MKNTHKYLSLYIFIKIKPVKNTLTYLSILFLLASNLSFAQSVNQPDTTKAPVKLGIDFSFNTNGFTPIPTFSLGRPALITNFYITKKRFSFDPQVLLSWDGKPWIVSYQFRYMAMAKKKFILRTGFSTGLSFNTLSVTNNNITTDLMTSNRFGNLEILSNYKVSKRFSIGTYYIVGQYLEKNLPGYINFLALHTSFSKLKLSKHIVGNFSPMVYYLNQIGFDGFYTSGTVSVAHDEYPFSLSFQYNQPIKTNIVPDTGFIWNLSLAYNFRKDLFPKVRQGN